jgi:hypothetical protein
MQGRAIAPDHLYKALGSQERDSGERSRKKKMEKAAAMA